MVGVWARPMRSPSQVNQARRGPGCFALVAGEEVAVDLEGEGDVGVAEAFADHPWVLAHGEEVGRMGVAEPMQREVRNVDRADDVGKALADVVGVGVGADDGGEGVAAVVPAVADEVGCFGLVIAVGPEDLDGSLVEVDGAA